ncbi:MAG: chemotaxis response regulator protein-glutamate methylesterase [candidate division NC10 bacterium]|nr:chemotaxis response regulator protein-glutamate methylesterase [candidate division NC10 bacterium]MDE2322656.1 chemotaxis response regulator protein-glutamate methylesterase [candidate division NC10 bacterium]
MIRILVADDSATVREYLTFLLNQDPALQVVGTARDGLDAVEQAERLKPDVIVMDVHMPRMNGYEATRQIMERVPTPIVMVSASSTRYEAATAFEALKAGALTVVEKPCGPDHSAQAEGTRRLLETVKLMAEVKVVRRWPKRERSTPPSPLWAMADGTIRLIAIGGSTGAPQIIADILAKLPRDLWAPILVVQHIAPGFTGGFAEWLAEGTRLTVKLAESGEATRPGTVYLAPEGSQTGITKEGRIRLTKEPIEDGFCPSASYLFQSVAEAFGRSALGILLTGMGRDGAAGLKRLREAGGVTIAQDEESCVIFGMPAEAIRLGAVEHVLSPEQIVGAIRSLVSHG